MRRLGRILRDVGAGLTAVVLLSAVRRAIAVRRLEQGLPVRRTRRIRKLERQRARAAARWLGENAEPLRALLNTSEKATAQLSIWDNARRTSEAYVDSAAVVRAALAGTNGRPSRSDRRSLQDKLSDIERDSAPHDTTARTAQLQLEKLQGELSELVKALRRGAPADRADVLRQLVDTHDRTRRQGTGRLDEVAARRRLDELAALRETLELELQNLTTRAR